MTSFDQHWNYNDPEATRLKFLDALGTSSPEERPDEYLQLLTQIARCNSLQRKIDEAHLVLNDVEKLLPPQNGVAHIRYFLERGRTYNSAGDKKKAVICFTSALDVAKQLREDFYAVDALHMLAIAATPQEAIRINEEAIVYAEASEHQRAKDWLGSLYNNLGWSYFDKGEFEKALSVFLRALKWREEKQQASAIFLAKWCVARTLRALNRLDEAITIQLALFEELVNTDTKDGYVYEELAELYLLKNEPVHQMYFQMAHAELSQDAWLSSKEPGRIARLKELAG